MREELDRSKSQLKMENVPPPYYIEYRLTDVDQYEAEAAFGALREDQHVHARVIRVIVRVGDYKQDSYYGPGVGVSTLGPIDDDPNALRWQLWPATDSRLQGRRTKRSPRKKRRCASTPRDQPFDDFAHEPPLESIRAACEARFRPEAWREALEKAHRAIPHATRNSNRSPRTMRFRA